ncbi:MAG: acetyl-CoA carboxylase biotin carboxyl carrier protein subunit [Paludibacteraceae bacterium]|nr:acetyl-CoA carboxylase biotin carboxyl carrier protein subunit [Paludibacteraceae bacterium]
MTAEQKKDFVDFAVTARKYKTLLTPKYKTRKFWVNPDPMDVYSSIPGTVVDIYVKEGDLVEEGQQIMILEAMKMRNTIEMPFTAKIKKINIKLGDRIPKDTLLMQLEK